MFDESQATQLDLSSFDTSNVNNMREMFYNSQATTIYVSNKWNTSNVTDSSSMFYGVTNLVGAEGTTYNSSNPTDKTYAHVDGGVSNPGYFTYKAN